MSEKQNKKTEKTENKWKISEGVVEVCGVSEKTKNNRKQMKVQIEFLRELAPTAAPTVATVAGSVAQHTRWIRTDWSDSHTKLFHKSIDSIMVY